MKSFFFFLSYCLFSLSVCGQSANSTASPELDWRFRQADKSEWYEAEIPGCVHTDLIRHNLIEHPFYGTNEVDCQWVGEKDWIYETLPFSIDKNLRHNELVKLRFNGLDTYADVYLNNELLFKADNALRYWEADVKKILKEKNNVIRIYFHSPTSLAEEELKQLPYPLPYDGLRAVTRKPQYHYGWDWGPKLLTCGITKNIEWIAYDKAHFEDIYVEQLRVKEELANMKATFTIHAIKEGNYSILFESLRTEENWTTDIKLKRGMNIVELPFEIEGPYRWWCNGLGNPSLYRFDVTLLSGEETVDTQSIQTGLRNVKLVTQKDSIGESFYFSLNDLPVFAKGANMIPVKFFPGEAKEADYAELISKCKEANINMLRVWGGGVYEDEAFYRLCDENGIMVWQDFMFACAMYPADSSFIATVIEEANQQTKRLRHHPCIALWCGNNESAEGWENWGWQSSLTTDEKFRIARAYKDLFDKTLSKIVKKNTKTDYIESSPRYGRADVRSFAEGDSHYWGLWHDEENFEELLHKIPRFMSEFGVQSFPSEKVLKEMLVGDELSLDDPGIAQHQKHDRGFKLMVKYVQNWYPAVNKDSLEFYTKLTQEVQAEGICLGIEAQRRAMPKCMGTLFWQLNDVWPSFSWSAIDYSGYSKPLMNQLKTVYAPQLISCTIDKDELQIYWISDNYIKDEELRLMFSIYDRTQPMPDKHSESESLYLGVGEKVKLTQGSHLIYRAPIKEILQNASLTDKLIYVSLVNEKGVEKYSRKQKLIPGSNSYLFMP